MATKKTKQPPNSTDEVAEIDPDLDEPEELDIDETEIEGVALEVEVVAAVETSDDDDDDDDEEEDDDKALDELESEELEMLTEDEQSETIHVDERAEARAIRREAMALEADADAKNEDEFVCQSCFLVKRTSQLANKSKKICSDCAA